MRTIDDVCCSCGTYGPVAALATLGGGRQVALCGTCAHRRDAVRAFVAQFDRARRDAAPVARDAIARSTHDEAQWQATG